LAPDAITTLAEKGLPDWVIQAQVGHVAPEMMKTYSHVRRQALNQAADALEPTAAAPAVPPPQPSVAQQPRTHEERVVSQSVPQSAAGRGRVLRFSRNIGSPHWTIFELGSSTRL